MKKSHLLIVIVLAISAGYFAYPYFNTKSDRPSQQLSVTHKKSVVNSQTDLRTQDQPPVQNDSTERIESANPDSGSKKLINDHSVNLQNKRGTAPEENSGKAEVNSPSNTFSGGKNGINSVRDFSFYKLQTKSQIGISLRDPRLSLIKGYYQGSLAGNPVELSIGETESFIRFFDGPELNEQLSLDANNDEFFSNVNDNGNLIQIQNGDLKLFINIKDWPNLTLSMGLNSQVLLTKIR